MENDLLKKLREGEHLTLRQQITLIVQLSVPAIMAQISSIVMQYIDASMVGRLGARDSAAIGLVSTSTWLMGGLCMAFTAGFTVQTAQMIGASREKDARNLVKEGLFLSLLFSMVMMLFGITISGALPVWLGGETVLHANASSYFFIFALFLPAMQLNSMAGGMLQSSGNMKVPSMLHILMCLLDVAFNLVLIFPGQSVSIMGMTFWLPGAGLGVMGAALGTALAEAVIACAMLYFLLIQSAPLHLRAGEKMKLSKEDVKNALRIAVPVGFEQFVMSGAQIAGTRIVAPLGTVSIAANSFSVTAESLCYMPGYGIGTAATTLVGQSIGAKRKKTAKQLGWLATAMGMAVMGGAGVLMYLFAPAMIGILSPDPEIRRLGTEVLRIEAFAEPLYAASIVASGVFRGAGDTLVPSIMSFVSMWAVRLPLAAAMAPRLGLRGVWIAMCAELCFRGVIFLIRLARKRL